MTAIILFSSFITSYNTYILNRDAYEVNKKVKS